MSASAPRNKRLKTSSPPPPSDQQVELNEHNIKLVQLNEHNIKLVQWEEWALSTEEHFHAVDLHARMPNGAPMGHVHR